jgi:acyl dehydratase
VTKLSEEALSFIGFESEPVTAPYPLTADTLRRFAQAVMDPSPIYYDDDYAKTTRYGEVVASPLWPTHAFVRPAGTPDPLDALFTDPDFDGVGGVLSTGLPKVPLTQTRLINGGTEAEFYQLAKVGDVITQRSKYVDIFERESRSGPMVVVKAATTYTNQLGEVLCVVTKSMLWR